MTQVEVPQRALLPWYELHRAEVDGAISRVLAGGHYVLGDEVRAFEEEFAAWHGLDAAVGVANGTDALTLALWCVGVGPGDRVVTVSNTAVATAAAVVRAGAVPVVIDVDPSRHTMDPTALAEALEAGDVAAVLVVHLYGHPADVEAIADLAAGAGVPLVEDCAQAHGAAVAGRMVGSWGSAAAFSFYPTKNLGAVGDAGLVGLSGTATSALSRLRGLRQYGWQAGRDVSEEPGMNSRLDELQAAVLRVGLRHLAAGNARRADIARRYSAALAGSPIAPPSAAAGVVHAWHQYVVRAPARDHLRSHLAAQGIATAVHYPVPIHRQRAYADIEAFDMPVTERLAAEVVSLPMFPELTDTQVERVCASLSSWGPSA